MPKDSYSKKEAQTRFETALKGALKTPHEPLKESRRWKSSQEKYPPI